MTTRVDVEEIETTKGEKLLATVLAGFLLIGLLWVYFHIDVERDYPVRNPEASLTLRDRDALHRHDAALRALSRARALEHNYRVLVSDRREAYRTALDEGRRDPALQRRYEAAQVGYARAQSVRRAALERERAARSRARIVQHRLSDIVHRQDRAIERQEQHDSRVSVVRRLLLVLLALGAAYLALGRLRRRGSRYLPTGMSAVGAVALLALVMAVDYLADYIDVTDLGVLVLSIAGALMTLAAFAALQRYLARRLPERRVRRRECPFCGYPTAGHAHCEGCGRDVVAACATCRAARRVGTRHCGACGAT